MHERVSALRIGSVQLPPVNAAEASGSGRTLGVWSFLVEIEGKLALVDCGLPADMEETDAYISGALGEGYGYTGAGQEELTQALDEVGIDPGEIEILILTHLHHDHAGGVEWLNPPEVWVHEAEQLLLAGPYSSWFAPQWQVTTPMRQTFRELDRSGKLKWWSGHSSQLSHEVDLLWVGGHSPGSTAVLLRYPGESLALIGDLLLSEEEATQGRIPDLATDLKETVDGVRAAAERCEYIWTGHASNGPVSASVVREAWSGETPECS